MLYLHIYIYTVYITYPIISPVHPSVVGYIPIHFPYFQLLYIYILYDITCIPIYLHPHKVVPPSYKLVYKP